eukprot:365370-Chlamydomonas_euryale.AAC.13
MLRLRMAATAAADSSCAVGLLTSNDSLHGGTQKHTCCRFGCNVSPASHNSRPNLHLHLPPTQGPSRDNSPA